MSSCMKYQYFTVRGELPQNESGAFVFETDSLKVKYEFSPNGSLVLKIENKLDELISIDWEKSAIVFDGRNLPYSSSNMKLSATGNSNQLLSSNTIDFDGTIIKSSNRSYIQPHSFSSKVFHKIPFEYDNQLIEKPFERIDFGYGTGKRYKFDSEANNVINSYIYINKANDSKSILLNHNFRIIEVIETMEKNVDLSSNQFTRSKTTTFGNTVLLLGGSAIIVLAAISADEE